MPQVSNSLTALRAIGAEFAMRIYRPLALQAAIILGVLLSVSIWLTTLSAWWWILAGLVIMSSLVAAMTLIITRLIIRAVMPEQTPEQNRQVRTFVDKLEHVSAVTQTPYVLLLLKLTRDISRPREESFIVTLVGETKSLKDEYIKIGKQMR
jgi:multisubunit Na+/H+ antiporter MnhC subunit